MTKKYEDIYDDLNDSNITPRDKLIEYTNTLFKVNNTITPKAYLLESDIHNIPKTSDFMIDSMECPVCKEKDGRIVNIENPVPRKWVKSCPKCKAKINFFTPQPIQYFIKSVDALIVNVVTGYGLGKTTNNLGIVWEIAHSIDGADILVGGSTETALNVGRDELKKFLEHDGKEELVQQNPQIWRFKNGSRVRWMSANASDVAKIRGWNLNLVLLLEGSSQNYYKGGAQSFFNESKGRLRNDTGYLRMLDSKGEVVQIATMDGGVGTAENEASIQKMIIESNPAPTAIVEEVINKSTVLVGSENVANFEKMVASFESKYNSINAASGIVTILASSRDNKVLPESYLRDNFGGMPTAYVARMRDCDLTRNEAQVFPYAMDCQIPISKVNGPLLRSADKIFQGYDPGVQDPSGIIYAAVWKDFEDTGKPKIIVFSARTTKGGKDFIRSGNTFKDITTLMGKSEARWGLSKWNKNTGRMEQGWIDGRTGLAKKITRISDLQIWRPVFTSKDGHDQDMESTWDRFFALGYDFQKAFKNPGSIQLGIGLINEYMEEGILEWIDTLEDLREEFIRYWYVEKGAKLEPMQDKWNHLMDALRYIIVAIKSFLDEEPGDVINVQKTIKPENVRPVEGVPLFLQNQKVQKKPGSNRFKTKGLKRR